MAMIAFPPLVVIPHLADAGTPIKQRVFEPVLRRRDGHWHAPEHHLDDAAVVVVNALVEQQLCLHAAHDGISCHMASNTTGTTGPSAQLARRMLCCRHDGMH